LLQYLFWNAKKVPKALFGGLWLRARVILLERQTDGRKGNGRP